MKNASLRVNYRSFAKVFKDPVVQDLMKKAVESEMSTATLNNLVLELSIKMAENCEPEPNITVNLYKGGKAAKAKVDNVLNRFEGINEKKFTLLCKCYREIRQEIIGVSVVNLVDPLQHKGQESSVASLYRALEQPYEYMHDQHFYSTLEEFYKDYIRFTFKPNASGLSYLSEYSTVQYGLKRMNEKAVTAHDENRALTICMISEFCKQTSKDSQDKHKYSTNPKFYIKFVHAVNVLRDNIISKVADVSTKFLDLPFKTQQVFIRYWVKANIDSYKEMNVEYTNELVEIGFITGSSHTSLENSIERLTRFMKERGKKKKPGAVMPKKSLEDF